MSQRMPVVFAGHGSPLNAILDNKFSQGWTSEGASMPKPAAILAISAHWYTRGTYVNDSADPKQVYDMYGFPQELYDLKYPAPGSPKLAAKVRQLLRDAGASVESHDSGVIAGAAMTAGASVESHDGNKIASGAFDVQVDNSWGIDHGTWAVLHHMFPSADIPVVQLSVNAKATPEEMFAIGEALRPLRYEGVLIFASGNIVHNLSMVDWNLDDSYNWAKEFDEKVRRLIVAGEYSQAVNYKEISPDWSKAVPTPEHYLPLIYALGAINEDDSVRVWNNFGELGSIMMTSYTFADVENEDDELDAILHNGFNK